MSQPAVALPSPSDPNWNSYIQAPRQIADAASVQWDDVADVVVVGFGGAGACAALEARAHGVDVLALDRFDGGGATALSGGIYYGGGTRWQREAGYEDTADQMYRYLKLEVGEAIQDATLRRFCDESSANMEWLVSHGVQFGSHVYSGKRTYPPVGYDLYYSGNEKSPGYASQAKPAPRGHRVIGTGYTGEELYQSLRESALKKGVRLRSHSPVTRLVVDSSNTVIGVEVNALAPDTPAWKQHRKLIDRVNAWQRFFEAKALKTAAEIEALERSAGKPKLIRARGGVVLSTGSFAFNRGMVRQYAPKYKDAMPLGTIGCDGSGIRLGQSVGGSTGYMDSVTAWRSISPPLPFVCGMVVNSDGKRFVTEDCYLGRLGYYIAEQTQGRAWVIINKQAYRESFRDTLPAKGSKWGELGLPLLLSLLTNYKKGRTLQELAVKTGISPDGLVATARAYNASVQAGQDEFGKLKDHLKALGDGPYYAIDISIGSKKSPCPSITMGGLNVDENTGHVIRADGTHINGLFAAGRSAKGVPSGFYVSGSSISDCVFAGRRAGLTAAKSASGS